MHLNDLAQVAWEIADDKGFHTVLDHTPTMGPREQALLALVPLTVKVNEVVQALKRHGPSLDLWDTVLFDQETALTHLLEDTFGALLRLCDPAAPPVAADHGDATTIRLLLMGTEVAEALTVIDSPFQLALELSDVFIRGGDLAHGLKIDLDTTVPAVLDANTRRPYGFGTPLEIQGAPHAPQ